MHVLLVLFALLTPHDYLHDIWKSSGTPGISVAVAVKGEIVYAEGAGMAELENQVPATPQTVWNIGSVSKVITAVAVMQLVERGQVSLDDPIQKYVPEFPVKPEGTITIRHLLTHTSGIRHYERGDFPGTPDNENTRPSTWIEGLKIFAGDPLQFAPGTRYLYSSYAVNLLQGVVERASGQPFEQYLAENIWRPAGMAATTFDVPTRIVPRRARSYRIVSGAPVNYFYNDLAHVPRRQWPHVDQSLRQRERLQRLRRRLSVRGRRRGAGGKRGGCDAGAARHHRLRAVFLETAGARLTLTAL
ncbi:MAG TPA: serine hydrolase domain-containing protein [Thermoanaerobaculia bacterium]